MKFGIFYILIFFEYRFDGYYLENFVRLKRVVEGLKKVGLWKNVIEFEVV